MSKPAKQARMMGQTQVTRTESVGLLPASSTVEVKDPHSSTHPLAQGETVKDQMQRHPKGHKVAKLSTVWGAMDAQKYLRVTDTLALNDVWVQPKAVEPGSSGNTVTVLMRQMVNAWHIKERTCTAQMSVDDLLKMLFMTDSYLWAIQGPARFTYDEWLADKTAAYIKKCGVDKTSDRAGLCNFILTEDREFTFYPQKLHNTGVFLRKICCHSYKDDTKDETKGEEEGKDKIENPSMIKCSSARGTFEYLFEARLFPLPDEWWQSKDVPDTQVMEL